MSSMGMPVCCSQSPINPVVQGDVLVSSDGRALLIEFGSSMVGTVVELRLAIRSQVDGLHRN